MAGVDGRLEPYFWSAAVDAGEEPPQFLAELRVVGARLYCERRRAVDLLEMFSHTFTH